jgi:hypothetical protein
MQGLVQLRLVAVHHWLQALLEDGVAAGEGDAGGAGLAIIVLVAVRGVYAERVRRLAAGGQAVLLLETVGGAGLLEYALVVKTGREGVAQSAAELQPYFGSVPCPLATLMHVFCTTKRFVYIGISRCR